MPTNGGNTGQYVLQPSGNGQGFPVQATLATQNGYPASGPIPGATAPYWSSGVGPPSASFKPPYGSRYTNTTAAAGQFVEYVYKPTVSGNATIGVWTGVV
jgi:hypothetical protein